jgi:hypothetical protein
VSTKSDKPIETNLLGRTVIPDRQMTRGATWARGTIVGVYVQGGAGLNLVIETESGALVQTWPHQVKLQPLGPVGGPINN